MNHKYLTVEKLGKMCEFLVSKGHGDCVVVVEGEYYLIEQEMPKPGLDFYGVVGPVIDLEGVA